jgi:hypothetical protein
MMARPTSLREFRRLGPPTVFLLLVLAGCSVFAQWPVLRHRLGMADSGMWFMDSYAVLAASDAVRQGLDPFQANPLDPFHRLHSYSGWWFFLGDLGLGREDNFLVGGAWVALFYAAAAALLRPRTWRAAVGCALVALSPPVLLAVQRANNDLVVFVLLSIGLLALRAVTPGRLAVFAGMLLLATGLKFYPLVAGLALVRLRPPRLMLTAGVLTLLAAGAALVSVWSDLRHASIPAPDGIYTFGAGVLLRDLGWAPPASLAAGTILLILAGAVAWWRGWFVRLDDPRDDWGEQLAFAAGAALLVGCFVAGISYAYRLIFAVFLWPRLTRPAAGTWPGWPAYLLLAVLWLDGLYCVLANLLIGPMKLQELLRVQWCLRLLSQPLVWTGMAMLAGSLLELIRLAWCDTFRVRPRSP